MGITKHVDVDFITVLLQNQIGGLQVLHEDMWIDLPPLPEALVVNIGDFLQFLTLMNMTDLEFVEHQLLSNEKFKSAQHRVLVNRVSPRAFVACFFTTSSHSNARIYGPIKELLSEENPAKYREFSVPEFLAHYRKCANQIPPMLHFRI
ncbi:1-aminocyclopropane-1-carboxylate oxidase homolog 7-like [Vigna unguiculata]|uniref:1-aminocyclopropane-1-carboxylate oxidase homolog 7-like n=1 Tax=Vigna unguiculata TaxID=3917 RepID=UPI001016090C|nr:1-aminocyclopropane-1-carboxylate oxidase homolog 7-like [Vigna unguiculata]